MSQSTSYTNIQSISKMLFAENFNKSCVIINTVVNSMDKELSQNRLKVNYEQSAVSQKYQVLESPSMIRKSLQQAFDKKINELSHQNIKNEILLLKKAALETIVSSNIKVDNTETVVQSLQNLVNAKSENNVISEIKSTFKTLEIEHSNMFIKSLANATIRATSKIGFNNIKTEIVNNTVTRVIAIDDKSSKGIVAEIYQDPKTKKIDMLSETVGISDGTCVELINKFNDALKEEGITSETIHKKWTGGVCELEYARNLKNLLSKSKQSEVLRTRKLNQRKNIQINLK